MSKQTWKHDPYNGWPNWFTWNVALWFQNDYNLSLSVEEYVKERQSEGKSLNYDGLLEFIGIERGTETPDGAAFWSPNVNRQEMRKVLARWNQ